MIIKNMFDKILILLKHKEFIPVYLTLFNRFCTNDSKFIINYLVKNMKKILKLPHAVSFFKLLIMNCSE